MSTVRIYQAIRRHCIEQRVARMGRQPPIDRQHRIACIPLVSQRIDKLLPAWKVNRNQMRHEGTLVGRMTQ